MVGDVPYGDDGNPQPRVWPGVGALDPVQSVLRVDGGQNPVAVIERIAEVL